MSGGHQHRSTLTQTHKAFKSRHKTKGAIKASTSGKVNARSGHGNKLLANEGRLNRKNKAKQLRQQHAEELRANMRASKAVPLCVALIPLTPSADLGYVRRALVNPDFVPKQKKGSSAMDAAAPTEIPALPFVHHRFDKSQTLAIISCSRDTQSVVEAIKVADLVFFVLRAEEGMDLTSNDIVDVCRAQGVANPTGVIHSVTECEGGKATHVDIRKGAHQFLREQISTEVRVFPVDTSDEQFAFRRALSQVRLKPPQWRSTRGFIVTDEVNYVPGENGKGILEVTGHVRGGHVIHPEHPIHIANFGQYQVESIVEAVDPHGRRQVAKGGDGDVAMGEAAGTQPTVYRAERRDSLRSEGDPTFLENEQTWPTAEEMEEAEARIAAEQKANRSKLPKGTSDYQAAWLEGVSDGEVSDGDEAPELANGADVDMAEDGMTDADRERAKRVELEARNKDDMEFPDEVDTPMDKAARFRFARFRGLKSFKNSEWDPKENLPIDYAYIHQFDNFPMTAKRVLAADDGVAPGQYVTIRIADVPADLLPLAQKLQRPLIVSGLLQYEKFKSVVHARVQRTTAYEETVKSKESLIMSIGFREFRVQPLFSQDTPNCDKKKFERFFRHGNFSTATMIAPVHFGNSPVLLFKETYDAFKLRRVLVASGTFQGVNPDLIITKRIILSGYPFKIHKRTATVRYMFFNPEDVRWFKPVELWTKHGRVGHIRDALGTHGYMKVIFNQGIQHHDTVCLSLYKRMFPKRVTRHVNLLEPESDTANGGNANTANPDAMMS